MLAKLAIAFGLGTVVAGCAVWFAAVRLAHAPAQVTIVLPAPQAPALPAQAPAQLTPKPEPPPPTQPAPRKAVPRLAPAISHASDPNPIVDPPPSEWNPPPQEPAPAVNIANADPAPAEPPAPASRILRPPRFVPPTPVAPQDITLPAGTLITVRLRESLSTKGNSDGDSFHCTLDQPIVVDGLVVAKRGATQRGRIVALQESGRVKGRASLGIELTQLSTSDGQKVPIHTDTFRTQEQSGVKGDAGKVAFATGMGATIGTIGGGVGAAIGAGVGGAAGTVAVLATRGKQVELPNETRITFRLNQAVTVTGHWN